MTLTSLIDGQPGHLLESSDRGLHYGDGIFETLAVRDGHCEFWDAHLQRLTLGCRRLGLTVPAASVLQAEARVLSEGLQQGVLKIILTRGSGGRGYRVPETVQTRRMLSVSSWPAYPDGYAQHGVRIRVCELRLSHQPVLAGLKHLNRLEQVLARMEWSDPAIAEGLMLDRDNQLIEGTFTNLFVVANNRIITPRLELCGVAGVMRALIMQLSNTLGLDCREGQLTVNELRQADEIFLTNSIIGLWPVAACGDWSAPVGPVTRRLQEGLEMLRHEDRQR